MVLPYYVSKDESKSTPAKVTQLKSKDILEKVFVTLEAMNIGYLPKEDLFRYKMSQSKAVYDKDKKDMYCLQGNTVLQTE